ncbi:tetratricopeptide repeat protein 21B-like isoform X2 [Drosophila nasuta]|uniref:Tetratricopeptide repeat protein 21B-like isoform X2 n=3 Tax=Drosophila albomicans TaxID=7291 RepID=A0A9C6SXM2_DROAB|nr:tetratricopeptide repeat protein 21B-like isoform X2 [Drosophila albomicans]XP_060646259.1 tetratricopeptide repeat protein 21B-like isoform X2 [Drosophila nasuta]
MFMRGNIYFICGEYSKAVSQLRSVLNVVGEKYTDAYLLLAQILVEKKQYTKAFEYLELALVHKFTVRDMPMYHLLKGIIYKNQNNILEAHQSFLLAMQLAGGGVKTEIQPLDYSLDKRLTISDKMTLYIELIYILREMPDSQGIYESERILQTALEEFKGSVEMGRLVIAHSKLKIEKSDISTAIDLLSSIKPDQTYYVQARIQLANIYLQHQKNRCGFAKCFKDLVEIRPEPQNFLMLGEACLSIQETTTAICAYRNAYKMSPSNAVLARELGRAYVKSHHYAKALKYYHEVIQNPDCSALKLDLAELFLKLKHYQNSVNILSETDGHKINDDSLTELQLRTKRLLLLARVHEKSGNVSESLKALDRARDNQVIIQKRCAIDQSESLHEQHKILSKICLLVAQQAILIKNNELALTNFKECIKYTPNDIDILVSLAKLQMKLKEMNLCQNTCMQILQINANNESASLLMADLSFRKMEFENAAYHFSQLLILQPCNWTALTRLIEVMRRFGTLLESLPFLQRAAQASEQYKNSLELNYCNGLFEWYNGSLNSALRYFNLSRRDPVWGLQSKLNMIDICLNPDGETPNSNDIFEAGDSGEFNESRLIALRTAERLIKEMDPKPGENFENAITYRVLWNFLQIASKQKFQIETALKDLTELSQTDGNPLMVIVVYGIALALVQLKQIQRAKNHLKRIARLSWSYEDAEYLERSWLLLADIYIHANKLEVAESLVDRVLEYNKSCTKAYELAGYIAEKNQSYNNAIKYYENAWKSCGRSKPHIGYKLALSNMKKKEYTNAVNICQQVLKIYPDYTIIRKDILEKCRNNVRS